MGSSIPEEPRWAPDTVPAERALWRWAVEQLHDRVLILPQVAMTVGQGGRATEAEADLVLLDPMHGVTVVEVKGGTLLYDARRAVWRRREAGAAAIRDPVQQAKRTRSVVEAAIRAGGLATSPLALRWAVATPECRLEAPGEPVLDEAQLWDALAADQLEVLYRRTCGRLAGGERSLGEEAAARIASMLRGRTREGHPTLAVAVDEHEAQVRFHTESHRNVLRRFATHPQVLVRGAAGTGKTVLALEAAVQFASLGQRVLLVCWNVALARWLREELREQLAAIGSPAAALVTGDADGRVVVGNVVALAEQGLQEAPDEDLDAWYHEHLPGRLTPALTAGEFDVVVLDEAQDLSELWVLAVASLLAKHGRWYAFADAQQDLFHADAALPDLLDVQHELRENFRNSRAIASFAAAFGEVELDCVTGDGPAVRFVAVDHAEVVDATDAVARRLQRDERIADRDLAVLWLFHNPWRGDAERLAAAALTGERVTTNSASFKGMERPVVVLGLDADPSRADRGEVVARAIYAAATRARSLLVVVGDPVTADALGFSDLGERLRDARDAPPDVVSR
ncbi:MAG: DNA/RNA helicase domain-containing protein [Nitriliruptoraceae bacterium]